MNSCQIQNGKFEKSKPVQFQNLGKRKKTESKEKNNKRVENDKAQERC